MTTMEFDELKKIWDSQNDEPFYGINTKALHGRIQSKMKKAGNITNISELFAIIANISAGAVILGMNFYKQSGNTYMYILSSWMFSVALYSLASRIRRIKEGNQFDRSMLGDLDYAISLTAYQVRFSHLMRWNILPIGILILLGVWDGGKSVWTAVAILIFFVLTNYAAGWEHNIYKARKRELEILRNKLENEGKGNHPS